MNGKKSMPIIMAAAGIISLIGAILLFVLAVPRADATYKRVMEIMIATLMLILSALVFYYLYISRDVEPNFFLFDRTKKKNLPVEKLTFKLVNERMNVFVEMVGTVEQLWEEEILETEQKLGPRRVYRPLLAYKMLYDLGDKNLAAHWELLLNAKPNIVDAVCGALRQGGETEMVKAFRFYMDNYRANPEKIKDFVTANKRYIQGRMLAYIKKNIELFY